MPPEREEGDSDVALLMPADGADGAGASASHSRRPTQSRSRGARAEDAPPREQHYIKRANWLRAAVLGANDGLVSVGALVMGVSGATTDLRTLLLSTTASIVAGSLSMGVGEYISVSSQRDIEMADVAKEQREQERGPASQAAELDELTQIYIDRGLEPSLARVVAEQLTEKDVIRAHARDELGIDIDDYTNPWAAATASFAAFTLGGLVPFSVLLVPNLPGDVRLMFVMLAITLGLAFFGVLSAWGGGSPLCKGLLRVLLGGWLAMAISFGVGKLFGASPALLFPNL